MKTKIILKYIIGFIISILFSLLAISLIMKFSIFDKNYIINFLNKENYYDKVYKEIYEEMENEIMPSGFTNDIIKDTFTKEEVKKDIIIFINNIYDGKKTILNKEELKNNIQDNINIFLKQSNLKIIDNKGVDNFINDLVNIYKNEINLYSYADSFINVFNKISKMINIVLIGLVISLFIIILLSKQILQFDYLSSCVIASGLIILFIRLFIFEKIEADYLLIITENFSDILTKIINIIGSYLYYFGIGFIALGFILSCKVFFEKCQPKNKRKQNIAKKRLDVYN